MNTIDQYHLSRLQLINWGVFDGYHSIPFSANGALITSSSGGGKSSLLDAISLAFLPDHRRNFNASSDATAAGSSSGKRTVGRVCAGRGGAAQRDERRPRDHVLARYRTGVGGDRCHLHIHLRHVHHRPGPQMACRQQADRRRQFVLHSRRRHRHRRGLQRMGVGGYNTSRFRRPRLAR